MQASPTLTTPDLGTPSAGVMTNVTGTAASLTAGHVTTNANLTGVITSTGNATSIASQTGTGTKFVVDTSPTLVTPNLGTPTALVGTNISGTAASLTAGTVTTNANLTGVITSVGNATSIASQTGTGTKFVVDTSPTLVTPNLGTPSALTLTNATGLPTGGGGTGQSTYTDGQLLIGNSSGNTLTKASLTAGTGISITPGNGSISIAATGSTSPGWVANGRLTLATGVPVTTTDQTAKTTLYYTPYNGGFIDLYNGSAWIRDTLTEISIAVPATTSTMYDVWVYDVSGTPTLEVLAWTNDTTRATALAYQNGILVKSGTATRRYVGSFRTTGSSGQTEDSVTKRYVWNYYNRVMRQLYKASGDTSWNYATATWRQANSNTANQVDLVVGVGEDMVEATVNGACQTTAGGSPGTSQGNVGIGVSATSTNSATILSPGVCQGSALTTSIAQYLGYPGVGRYFFAWLEQGTQNTSNITWYGTNGTATVSQNAISARFPM